MEIRLLQHFKDVGGLRGKLELVGVQAEHLWHTASSRMNARIVSVDAMGWRFLHDLLAWEDSLAEHLDHPTYPTYLKPFTTPPALLDSYRLVLATLAHNHFTNNTEDASAIEFDPKCDATILNTWQFAIRVIELDLCITHIGLVMSGNQNPGMLSVLDITELLSTVMSLTSCSVRDYFPPQQMARALHIMAVMTGHNREQNRAKVQLNILWEALKYTPGEMMIIGDLKRVVEHKEGRVSIRHRS